MKKQLLFCVGIILSAAAAHAQNPINFSAATDRKQAIHAEDEAKAKAAAAPTFKFLEQDDTHDFGTIPEGPKVTYVFTFINTGKEPLLISNAQASCGCTSPEYPKEPILPGKKGKISVTYTTEGHVGNFAKSVYLTSNAALPDGQSRYELFIKGIVQAAKK